MKGKNLKCPNCGAKINGETNYCEYCGAYFGVEKDGKLEQIKKPETKDEPMSETEILMDTLEESNKTIGTTALIFSIFVLVAVFIFVPLSIVVVSIVSAVKANGGFLELIPIVVFMLIFVFIGARLFCVGPLKELKQRMKNKK